MNRCSHKCKDRTACRAKARPGSKWCTFHDPALAERRAEGRKLGGVARSAKAATLPQETPDLPLKTVADVMAALGEAYNAVRTGKLDARLGNCLGVLAGVMLKAIEGCELERRVELLEGRRGANR